VVVVIIGIVIAGTLLSLGAIGHDGQLQQERDRLTALISYVRDRGAMMTLEYGIRCGQHGYRFVYYDNRTLQWLPETLDDTLRARKLPSGLNLRLVIEGRDIVLNDNALQFDATAVAAATAAPAPSALGAPPPLADQAADNAPQIMLLSNGDTNAFMLTIERSSANRSVTVQSAGDGTIQSGEIVEAPQ